MSNFLAQKREMFLVQMALDTKRSEVQKLEQKAHMREEALKRSELLLEEVWWGSRVPPGLHFPPSPRGAPLPHTHLFRRPGSTFGSPTCCMNGVVCMWPVRPPDGCTCFPSGTSRCMEGHGRTAVYPWL